MIEATTSIALVGIGGYGGIYVSALLDAVDRSHARLAAAADPLPSGCKRLRELLERGVSVHTSIDELLAARHADLVVIASPIYLHCEQTVAALRGGSHVLCEKPLCVTPEQAARMRAARDAAGRQVAVGYQWSFSPAIQQLKRDVMSGALGAPVRLKAITLWPRDEAYYGRNAWAGRRGIAGGQPVMDSPANNACAHFLHNMLYVLGDRVDRSAIPAAVTAELYRAHPIETYDTAAIRCHTTGGAEVLFVVSHATRGIVSPTFCYEFENAVVRHGEETGGHVVARFHDGTVRDYGAPSSSHDARKLWATVDAIRAGTPVPCGIEAATAQTLVVSAAEASMPEAVEFPARLVQRAGDAGARKTWVEGLDDVLLTCYRDWRLPSELGAAWSAPGDEVDMTEAPATVEASAA